MAFSFPLDFWYCSMPEYAFLCHIKIILLLNFLLFWIFDTLFQIQFCICIFRNSFFHQDRYLKENGQLLCQNKTKTNAIFLFLYFACVIIHLFFAYDINIYMYIFKYYLLMIQFTWKQFLVCFKFSIFVLLKFILFCFH